MWAISLFIAAPKSRLRRQVRVGSRRSASTTVISAGRNAYYLERNRQCRTRRPAYRQRRAAHRAARRNPPRSWHQPDCLRLSIGRWAGHLNDLTVNAAYSAPSSRSASPIKPGEISIWLTRSEAIEFSPYRLLLPAETRRVLLQQFALRPHEASGVVLSHLLLQRIVCRC